MPPEPRDEGSARPRHRWVIELLLVVVIGHSLVLALWLAPANPVRDAVGERRLASYVNPYFQQGRDVAGIGAHRVDESFSVRAFVVPDGKVRGEPTEWVDLTDLGNRATRHDPTPARTHLIARRLATNLNQSMFGLTREQRTVVRRLKADDLPGVVTTKLQAAGGRADAVRLFQTADQMATQFASLYAQSRWDGRVVQVQIRVGRRTVPPYSARHRKSVDEVDFQLFSFGWRRAVTGSAEARAIFDSYAKQNR